MTRDKQTIAANTDGLGNRIKCLVSALLRDPDAKVFWPKNNRINCEFIELFDNEDLVVSSVPEKAEVVTSWRLTGFPAEYLPEGFSTYQDHPRDGGRMIDFEYERIPDPIKELALPFFENLRPSETVMTQIRHTKQKLGQNTVGVHIRSWCDDTTRAYKFSLSNYFKIMDQFPIHDFYVASDSPDIAERVKKRYPGRVTIHNITGLELRRGSVHQKALAEMYLLGLNRWIITSHGSTFSEVAWWLGGASAEVHIAPLRKWTGRIDEENLFYMYYYKAWRRLRKLF